jgi:hypothetical protein
MHHFNRSLLLDHVYTQRIWSGDQDGSDYFDDFGIFDCPRDPFADDCIPVQAGIAAEVRSTMPRMDDSATATGFDSRSRLARITTKNRTRRRWRRRGSRLIKFELHPGAPFLQR